MLSRMQQSTQISMASLWMKLVNEASQFFENKDFNQNIVDMLVKVTADALEINFFIHQHNGKIQVIQIKSGHYILCKEVQLKFSSGSESSLTKCYDAIVVISAILKRYNISEATCKDQQQGNVIDLLCTENNAGEGYVTIDLTCSPQN